MKHRNDCRASSAPLGLQTRNSQHNSSKREGERERERETERDRERERERERELNTHVLSRILACGSKKYECHIMYRSL